MTNQRFAGNIWGLLQEHQERLRRLEGQLAGIAIGSKLIATVITGVVPPSSGGSGIQGSPLGVTIWQNNSGGTLAQGAVVVYDGDRIFTTTTTQGSQRVIGVVDGSSSIEGELNVAASANARVRHVGYQAVVNVVGAVAVGDYLRASTTATRAISTGTDPLAGVFAMALTAFAGPGNGTIAAVLFTPEMLQQEVTTKGDLLVGLAAGDLDRLAVGADGSFLKADSSAGLGMTWGTPATSTKQVYIPFGSETAQGDSYNNTSGAEAFRKFGGVERIVNPASFSFSPLRVVLEVSLKSDGVTPAKARLFDVTAGTEVAASTVITSLTAATRLRSNYLSLTSGDHVYRVDVGGNSGGTFVEYDAVLLIGDNSVIEGTDTEVVPTTNLVGDDVPNEIRNHPSLEAADNLLPLWWANNNANAALTEVDLAGEAGITEKYERALKLVVTTAASYAKQLYTYADEPRLKSGKTYSVAVDVWAVSGAEARVRLQSSVGSLGVASTTTAAWTRKIIEAVAIDGTTLELRLEGDVGTFYFKPLGLAEGINAPTVELQPRKLNYKDNLTPNTAIETLTGSTSKAVADLDLTSVTSPLAVMGNFHMNMGESTTGIFDYYARPNGTSWTVTGGDSVAVIGRTEPADAERSYNNFVLRMDDSQIIETAMTNSGGGAIDNCVLYLQGYWEWE